MWIVQLALRRPYTFVVLAMLIVLFGVLEILRMPTDIYPEINIPVVAAIWSYNGLPPREMEGRIATQFERAATTTVSGIAAPAFVSTLCICIVFVPVVFIAGAAKSLFVPLAMAVVFAMLTSYFLSRTLVPTMVQFLLGSEPPDGAGRGPLARLHAVIERGFERLRDVRRVCSIRSPSRLRNGASIRWTPSAAFR
jgi:multidrug efflux pump subunit AcrB